MKKLKYATLVGLSGLFLTACAESSDAPLEKISTESEIIEESETLEESEIIEESSSAIESVSTETSARGKRSNPVSIQQSATWDITYSDSESNQIDGTVTTTISNVIRGEEAYNQLVSYNESNEPAPEGYEWVIFDLTLTLNEGSEDDPFSTSTISIKPIASDGSEVSQTSFATFEEGTGFGWKNLYEGGKDSGKVGLIIPEGDDTLIELSDTNTSIFYSLN